MNIETPVRAVKVSLPLGLELWRIIDSKVLVLCRTTNLGSAVAITQALNTQAEAVRLLGEIHKLCWVVSPSLGGMDHAEKWTNAMSDIDSFLERLKEHQ